MAEELESACCRETLEVLLELTRKLTGGLTLDKALKTVTEAAMLMLPCEHASVRILDEAQSTLLTGARSGRGSKEGPMSFLRGDGIVGWVAKHGKSVRIGEARDDKRFKRSKNQGFEIRSIMAIPLHAGDRVVGVLGVTSSQSGAFEDEHELLATLLANCAVPAIERARLEHRKSELERLAVMDHQTQAFNQRYLMPRLKEEMSKALSHSWPMSLLLMDLDNFKSINDHHGHAAGDCVLQSFAERVFSSVRSSDVFVRRGGDEFALIMPYANGERALEVGERVRESVVSRPLDGDSVPLKVTVSIGVATWDRHTTAEALEKRADEAMYRAKRAGRNRVVTAESPAEVSLHSD